MSSMDGGGERVRLEQLAQLIDEKIASIDDVINRTLSAVPDLLREAAEKALDLIAKMWVELTKVGQKILELLKNLGNPDVLMDVSEELRDLSGLLSVHTQVPTASGSIAWRAGAWDGEARSAYRFRLPDQRAALESVVDDLVVPIADGCRDCALALLGMYAAAVAAMFSFKLGLVGGIAQCLTVIGLPTGVATIIAAAAVCAGTLAGVGVTFGLTFSKYAGDFETVAMDFGAFGEQGWPRLAT